MRAPIDAPTLPAPLPASTPVRGLVRHAAAWRRWAQQLGLRGRPLPAAALTAARQACVDCLADVERAGAPALRERLLHARSLDELWHLRPELYRLLALQHSQAEAERRLAAIAPAIDRRGAQRPR